MARAAAREPRGKPLDISKNRSVLAAGGGEFVPDAMVCGTLVEYVLVNGQTSKRCIVRHVVPGCCFSNRGVRVSYMSASHVAISSTWRRGTHSKQSNVCLAKQDKHFKAPGRTQIKNAPVLTWNGKTRLRPCEGTGSRGESRLRCMHPSSRGRVLPRTHACCHEAKSSQLPSPCTKDPRIA